MYIWDDLGNEVRLLNSESFGYEGVILLDGEVNCFTEEEEEIYKYSKEKYEEAGISLYEESWKVQALKHFTKVMLAKNVDDNTHVILTNTSDTFEEVVSSKRKVIIYKSYYDKDTERASLEKDKELSILYKEGKYHFIDVYNDKRFVSEQNELYPAVNECLEWVKNGMPEQTIELYNISSIAEKFNKHRQNVHKYYKEGRLPIPYAKVGDTPYWHPNQIHEIGRALK